MAVPARSAALADRSLTREAGARRPDRDGGTSYDHRAEKDVIEVMSAGRTEGRVHFPMHARVDGAQPSG